MESCLHCGASVEDVKAPCPGCGQSPLPEIDALNKELAALLGQRYELTSELGRGNFGDVYRARDQLLNRDVAIKRVRLENISEPSNLQEAKQRFLREASIAAQLNHPNIVTIFDIIDAPTTSFIVMEFLNGRTLEALLKQKKRFGLQDTLEILSQAADALDYAHQSKVIHRDVKPANIMIADTGRVKVMDFGIAKSEASGDMTSAGIIVGTPHYMSPEQAQGETKLDGRADLFSLGCVMYECLSGEKPFRGDNAIGILMKIVGDSRPTLEYDELGLHPGLGEVVERALAKEPEKRFGSGAELIDALRSLPEIETPHKGGGAGATVSQPLITRRDSGTESVFDPDVRGSLNEKTLAEVIREVYAARKTGILHLQKEGIKKRIYFRKGTIVFANSDVNDDRLGEFLIRVGDIDRSLFDLASRVMKQTGQRLGRTIVELGKMSEEAMESKVREQIKGILFSLFDWGSGDYGFERLDQPVEEDIILDLSTADTILEGIRSMNSPERVRSALGDLDRVLEHSENPLLLYQQISLTPAEGFVLSRVDGSTTVAEAASISPLGEEETLRCVYGLVSAGVLELQDPSSCPTSRMHGRDKGETEIRAPRVDVPRPEEDVPPPVERVKSSKSPPEAARAGPWPEEQEILDDIAAKHASLSGANYYEMLGIEPTADYAEIKKAYYVMVKKYHPDRHHSPRLRSIHGLLEELFVKVQTAYEVLSTPMERRRYDESIGSRSKSSASSPGARGSETSSPTHSDEIAEARYRDGKRHFDNMSYHDAIQCLEEAVRLNPRKASYHRLLAMALSKNPHWKKEAELHFRKAIEIKSTDLESHLGLAEIYEIFGLDKRAQKMYQRVLELDPENELAQEKVHGKRGGGKKGLKKLRRILSIAKG